MMPNEVVDGRMCHKLQKKHARLDIQYTEVPEKTRGRDLSKEEVRSVMSPTVIRLVKALYGKNYSVRKKEM
jgi:FAD synthase